MLNLSTVDWTQSALIGALLLMGVTLLLEMLAVGRLRRGLNRDLARIFEQLDLVRFESQQQAELRGVAPEARPAPRSAPRNLPAAVLPHEPVPGEGYAAALQLAASGADRRELVDRCGLSPGEARILVAMQGARRATAQ